MLLELYNFTGLKEIKKNFYSNEFFNKTKSINIVSTLILENSYRIVQYNYFSYIQFQELNVLIIDLEEIQCKS